MRLAPLLAVCVLPLLSAVPARAQSALWRFVTPPSASSSYYGWDVAPAGDVDADGHPDLVIGAPFGDHAEVRSGLDGRVLLAWQLPDVLLTGPYWFGQSVDGGADATGDGRPDLVVGQRIHVDGLGPGHVHVYDGQSGAEHLDVTGPAPEFDALGASVAWIGDVNGDGLADLAAGAPQSGPGFYFGHAFVISGADGAVLSSHAGSTSFEQLGWDTLGPGDLTGDGVPEAVFSGPYHDAPGGIWSDGRVRVVSGADGTIVADLTGTQNFGWCLGEAGDLDLDGVPDLAIGTGLDVRLRSGASFAPLGTISAFNTSVTGGRDLTGDGVPDVAVGFEEGIGGVPGTVRVFSGASLQQLFALVGEAGGDEFGRSVCLPGDVNGDGREDVAAGAPSGFSLPPSQKGRVRVFDAGPPGFRALGGGAAGARGVPTLQARGSTQPDHMATIEVGGAAPWALAVLVSDVAVACDSLHGGVMVPQTGFVLAGLVTDALGALVVSARWPADASGTPHWMQVWIADSTAAGGWAATKAVVATTE
jgi:hypothetical protein